MRGVSLSDDASLAGEWLEIYTAATPSFLVVQKADGDGVDADAVTVVGAIGEGEGFDDARASPAAVVIGAAEAVVAGDDVAHFSGLGEFTVRGNRLRDFRPTF